MATSTAPAPQRVGGRSGRRKQPWVLGALGAVAVVVGVVVVSFMAILGGNFSCPGGSAGAAGGPPSAAAVSDIPPAYLRLYQDIGGRYGLDWAFLASIGAQESGHGSNASTSSAGCIGVMQLCGAFTHPPIAQDGNGDGDIQLGGTDDPADSIASAANGILKLKVEAFGDPHPSTYAQYRQVACRYYGACRDGSANYADEVMARAVQYGFTGAGSPPPSDPATAGARSTPAVDRSILSLGDSLAEGTAGPLESKLSSWAVHTDALTSRRTSAGVARLEARRDLPSVLAVSLGTNDSPSSTRAFRRDVTRVLQLAGPDRCVLWLSITRPPLDGVSYAGLNRVLTDVAATHTTLRVVVDHPSAEDLAGDGVHRTPAGYRARAQLIADAAELCIADPSSGLGDVGGAGSSSCSGAAGGPGGLEGIGSPDALALVGNPNITWSHVLAQTSDLGNGRVSPRLVSLLALIAQTHKITIFALASDHGPGTNHEAGRAADIAIVDDDNCQPPDRAGACWELSVSLARIRGCLHPTETIYYFDPDPGFQDANGDGGDDSFARSDHDDHIHVGYDQAAAMGVRHYAPDIPPCAPAALTGNG